MKPSKEKTTENKKENNFKFKWKKEYFFAFAQIFLLLFLLALIVIILINISNHLNPKNINYVNDLVSIIKNVIATFKDVFVVSIPVFMLYFDNIRQNKTFRNNENMKKIEIDAENKNKLEKDKKEILSLYFKSIDCLLNYYNKNNLDEYINNHYKFLVYFSVNEYYLLANNIYNDLTNEFAFNENYIQQTKLQCNNNIKKILDIINQSTIN